VAATDEAQAPGEVRMLALKVTGDFTATRPNRQAWTCVMRTTMPPPPAAAHAPSNAEADARKHRRRAAAASFIAGQ